MMKNKVYNNYNAYIHTTHTQKKTFVDISIYYLQDRGWWWEEDGQKKKKRKGAG